MSSRLKTVLLSTSAAVATVALVLSLMSLNDSGSAGNHDQISISTESNTKSESSPLSDLVHSKPSSAPIGAAKTSISPELKVRAEKCLYDLEGVYRELEFAKAEKIGHIEAENTVWEFIIIPQPSGEEFTKYSAALSNAVKSLPDEAKDWSRDQQLALLKRYTAYQLPFKLVSRRLDSSNESNRQERIVERFLRTRDSIKIEGNQTKITGGGIATSLSADQAKRYQHLFQLSQ